MAKKKTAARKAPGKKKGPKLAFSGGRSRQSKEDVEKVLTSGPLRTGRTRGTTKVKGRPKDVPLPGMEDMKDRILLKEAAAISDIRAQIADLKLSEAGHIQTSHRRMRQIDVMAFTAHGVEFARVPGEELLRVRTAKGRTPPPVEPDKPARRGKGKEADPDEDEVVSELEPAGEGDEVNAMTGDEGDAGDNGDNE